MTVPFHDISNINEVMAYNESKGQHFFSPDTMRFFNSKVHDFVVPVPHLGIGFITSEQYDTGHPRLYTVRRLNESGSVTTISKFQEFDTYNKAKNYLRSYVNWHKSLP